MGQVDTRVGAGTTNILVALVGRITEQVSWRTLGVLRSTTFALKVSETSVRVGHKHGGGFDTRAWKT